MCVKLIRAIEETRVFGVELAIAGKEGGAKLQLCLATGVMASRTGFGGLRVD